MDPSAQTLEQFVAACRTNKRQIAVIAPASTFLGIEIAEALLAQNLAVCCLAINAPTIRKHAAHLLRSPYFFVLQEDISELAKENQTLLLHYLSIVLPNYLIYDIDESIANIPNPYDLAPAITLQTKQLLDYARQNHPLLLLLSKIEFNATDPFTHIPSEKHADQKQIRDVKLFVQTLLSQAVQGGNFNARSISYGDIYGPAMPEDLADQTASMIQAVVTQRRILLAGDGLSVIRPVYISDFVYGVVKSFFSQDTVGKQYILTNPHETTELSVAQALQQAAASFNVYIDIVFTKDQKSNSFAQRIAYHDLASKELQWDPKVSLAEGLRITLRALLPAAAHSSIQSAVAPNRSDHVPVLPHTPATFPTPSHNPAEGRPAITVSSPPAQGTSHDHKKLRHGKSIHLPALPRFRFHLPHYNLPRLVHSRPRFGILFATVLLLGCIAAILITPYLLLSIVSQAIAHDLANITAIADNEKQLQNVQAEIGHAQRLLTLSLPARTLLRQKQTTSSQQLVLTLLSYSVKGQLAYHNARLLTNMIVHPTSQAFADNAQQTLVQLRVAQEDFAIAQAYQKQLTTPLQYNEALHQAEKLRQQNLPAIEALQQTVIFTAALFANSSQQTFAILPIDSNTLRPGGGVITGIINLSLPPNKAPVLDMIEQDDARMGAIIPTSPTVKTYSHQSVIDLPQSLWEPQFDKAITPFYGNLNLAASNQLRGVLGIDVSGLKKLLALTGPVTVANPIDQNKEVSLSADNLQTTIAQWYSKIPNDQASAKAITQVTQQILSHVVTADVSFDQFATTIKQLFEEQHLLFFSQDRTLAQTIATTSPQLTVASGDDLLKVVDANLDANKVNVSIKRTIHHDIVISGDNSIAERVVITYRNESTTTTAPFGTYHGISQITVPGTTKLSRVTIDGKKPVAVIEDATPTVKMITTPVTLAPTATATIVFELQDTNALAFIKKTAQLRLTVLKQPGTDDTPYELAIKLPPFYKLAATNQQFDQYADGFLLKTTLDQAKNIVCSITE